MGMIPIVPGQRYAVSHSGSGTMELRLFDERERELHERPKSPSTFEVPREARWAQVVYGGEIYQPRLVPAKTDMPDRLSIDPKSAFYDAALIGRGVGVRFKGVEKTNVAEYCISEAWVRVQTGVAKDREGRPLCVKLQGAVEVWMRDEA